MPTPITHEVKTFEDMPKLIQLEASDPDGDKLEFAVTSEPEHGFLCGKPSGRVTYTPDEDYNGTDTFAYSVSDGKSTSPAQTVTVTIHGSNDAPKAMAGAAGTRKNAPVIIGLHGEDVDGDKIDFEILDPPKNGSLSAVTDPPSNLDGAVKVVTYTPARGFVGADAFTFKVTDGKLASSPATVTVTVHK